MIAYFYLRCHQSILSPQLLESKIILCVLTCYFLASFSRGPEIDRFLLMDTLDRVYSTASLSDRHKEIAIIFMVNKVIDAILDPAVILISDVMVLPAICLSAGLAK